MVAEGYVFEFERRGYLRAGCFVPEVVLNHPELVQSLYEEFVHAGSDIVLAFTVSGDSSTRIFFSVIVPVSFFTVHKISSEYFSYGK